MLDNPVNLGQPEKSVMKYLLAIIKRPFPRYERDERYKYPSLVPPYNAAFSVLAWDEANDFVDERLGLMRMDASIYNRLVAQDPNDPVTDKFSLCEFKNKESYIKGRKLFGHHAELLQYRKLIQPCDRKPLSESDRKQIKAEYADLKEYRRRTSEEGKLEIKWDRFQFIFGVDDLASDWGISTRQLYSISVSEEEAEEEAEHSPPPENGGPGKARKIRVSGKSQNRASPRPSSRVPGEDVSQKVDALSCKKRGRLG